MKTGREQERTQRLNSPILLPTVILRLGFSVPALLRLLWSYDLFCYVGSSSYFEICFENITGCTSICKTSIQSSRVGGEQGIWERNAVVVLVVGILPVIICFHELKCDPAEKERRETGKTTSYRCQIPKRQGSYRNWTSVSMLWRIRLRLRCVWCPENL